MLARPGFDYNQKYIEHGYIELCIPPKGDQFAMPHNYLHIWPRGEFMMIALPNQDKTWTVTLFMPFKIFESLETPDNILQFFRKHFPDSIPLIGEKRLIADVLKLKPQSLLAIKVDFQLKYYCISFLNSEICISLSAKNIIWGQKYC